MDKKLLWEAIKEEFFYILIALTIVALLLVVSWAIAKVVVLVLPVVSVTLAIKWVVWVLWALLIITIMVVSIRGRYNKKIQDKTWKK